MIMEQNLNSLFLKEDKEQGKQEYLIAGSFLEIDWAVITS